MPPAERLNGGVQSRIANFEKHIDDARKSSSPRNTRTTNETLSFKTSASLSKILAPKTPPSPSTTATRQASLIRRNRLLQQSSSPTQSDVDAQHCPNARTFPVVTSSYSAHIATPASPAAPRASLQLPPQQAALMPSPVKSATSESTLRQLRRGAHPDLTRRLMGLAEVHRQSPRREGQSTIASTAAAVIAATGSTSSAPLRVRQQQQHQQAQPRQENVELRGRSPIKPFRPAASNARQTNSVSPIRKAQTNPSKIYAIDAGLINAYTLSLSPNYGHLFENLI